jgi:CRISPR-associated protein Csb2
LTAIGVRYLCGWSASTDVSSRMRAEWPPHIARLYMALAAAHFETGSDKAERTALEWLETQDAPRISCSVGGGVTERDVVGVYVPVNDVESSKELWPALRPKQLRTFPRVRPENDTVYFLWDSSPDGQVQDALKALCRKVTRLGHSSSLVQAWLVENGNHEIPPALIPDPLGPARLRIPTAGLLRELERAFNGAAVCEYHQLLQAAAEAGPKLKKKLREELQEKFPNGAPVSRRPQIGAWQGYSQVVSCQDSNAIIEGVFDPNLLILTRQDGPNLNLESTIQLTGALRDAVMKASPQPPPEWVSGHEPNGGPSRKPHLAFFPLPYVGGKYGDGHILGLAIAIPRGADPEEVRERIGPLLFDPDTGKARPIPLWKNSTACGSRIWEWELERESRQYPPQSLRAETWTGPDREWDSVTPVVLHHHPKPNRAGHIEAIMRQACESAGLPQPAKVTISSVSRFRGVGRAIDVPPFAEGGANLSRYQVHATLAFESPVEGPVLIGRGRYRGYGLFRPTEREKEKK